MWVPYIYCCISLCSVSLWITTFMMVLLADAEIVQDEVERLLHKWSKSDIEKVAEKVKVDEDKWRGKHKATIIREIQAI